MTGSDPPDVDYVEPVQMQTGPMWLSNLKRRFGAWLRNHPRVQSAVYPRTLEAYVWQLFVLVVVVGISMTAVVTASILFGLPSPAVATRILFWGLVLGTGYGLALTAVVIAALR